MRAHFFSLLTIVTNRHGLLLSCDHTHNMPLHKKTSFNEADSSLEGGTQPKRMRKKIALAWHCVLQLQN